VPSQFCSFKVLPRRRYFGYSATPPGVKLNDLSTVPQCGLLSIAPGRNRGFFLQRCPIKTVAMPHLQSAFSRSPRRDSLCEICALPAVREFRSGANLARPRGGRNFCFPETLSESLRLPVRPLPPEVLQCVAISSHPSLHDARPLSQSFPVRKQLNSTYEPPSASPTRLLPAIAAPAITLLPLSL
jgi:hypothetical protein